MVKFRDGETLFISDIIEFEEKQQDEIKAIALDYTKVQLRKYEQEGKNLSYLTNDQKEVVLYTKNLILFGKTANQLSKEKIVVVSIHSLERLYERLGSDELSIIIDIIDRIFHTDFVLKAQFKGYSKLSYTLMEKSDPDKFKLPISFFRKINGLRYIRMITLTFKNSPPKKMTTRLAQDMDLLNRMDNFKQKIKDETNRKNTEENE